MPRSTLLEDRGAVGLLHISYLIFYTYIFLKKYLKEASFLLNKEVNFSP